MPYKVKKMESVSGNNTFCPDKIFNKLDNYITQVQILDNLQVSNPRKIESRTLGLISLSEKLGGKEIEISKEGLLIYSAKKITEWEIFEQQLNSQQIQDIANLPQTKEQILIDFYGRKLTHKLKKIFQARKYPIDRPISLNHAQIPYDFFIGCSSTPFELIFSGINNEDEIVFESSFSNKGEARIIKNNLSLEHINQLSSFNP